MPFIAILLVNMTELPGDISRILPLSPMRADA